MSEKLTATEIIATKLLGWKRVSTEQGKEYEHPLYARAFLSDQGTYYCEIGRVHGWPDLADWNDIRRIEEAIAGRGLLSQYDQLLCDCSADKSHYEFTATQAQRIRAVLKLIESHGL